MTSTSPAGASGLLKLLRGTAAAWFIAVAAGQAVFALYIAIHYGGSALRGDFEAWSRSMIHGILEGDPAGNAAVFLHIVLAFVITVCGPLQLLPQIRARWPKFHRWNGRAYMVTAFVISLGGLYMVWTRGVLGPMANAVAISLNGVLIMAFAALALRSAMARRIDSHRRWATRLFLAVSGVWFFRVGMMLWILINGGPVGVGEELDGPFAITWAFGQYLVPLALYELYLRVQTRDGAAARLFVAGLLALATLGIVAGVGMATLFMWLPKMTA